jgi:hypothetical protein
MLKKAKAKSERTLEARNKEPSELFGIEMDNIGRKQEDPIDKEAADGKIAVRNRKNNNYCIAQ